MCSKCEISPLTLVGEAVVAVVSKSKSGFTFTSPSSI